MADKKTKAGAKTDPFDQARSLFFDWCKSNGFEPLDEELHHRGEGMSFTFWVPLPKRTVKARP